MTWDIAKASALNEEGKMFDSLIADHYKITLRIGECEILVLLFLLNIDFDRELCKNINGRLSLITI